MKDKNNKLRKEVIRERFGRLEDVEKEQKHPPPLTDQQRKEHRDRLKED